MSGAAPGTGGGTTVHRNWRRRAGVLAGVGFVVVAAPVVAGGGWCFAGELHRQALAIDPGSSQRRPALDLTVAASGGVVVASSLRHAAAEQEARFLSGVLRASADDPG